MAVDTERRPGRFLLTGSANVLLVPKVAESLAGRMELLTLWPLSQGEILGNRERFISAVFSDTLLPVTSSLERSELVDRAIAGGFPPAVARSSRDRRRAWLDSYSTTILQRDVRDLSNIEGLTALPRLLTLIAARTAGLFNLADISRASGIAQSTLKRYFALLETVYLVQTLPAWSTNQTSRLVKSPKLYLVDSGLLAALTGLTADRLRLDPTAAGPLFEQFVVQEIQKQRGWSQPAISLYHFRTQAGREVDLVLEDRQARIVGIEVKASATVTAGDFVGLRTLGEVAGKRFVRGVVLYLGHETVPFAANLHAMPIEALWTI